MLPLALLLLLPSAAQAAQSSAGDPFGSGLRMLGALGMILGLILLLYAGSRRGLRWLPKARSGAIRIVEVRQLGPKKSLCLVQVRGRELLLGVGADRVELLCQLGDEPSPSFDETLQQLGGRP
ncbi:MAG: flagellar biosynthetic protein FliO [Trichloromonadaceae bacterium]